MTSSRPPTEQIVNLNVGGQRFATSRHTLTWISDSFFTSLLSGRIPTVRDDTGAIFIDRDPSLFRIILNYLRTRQVDLSCASLTSLKHEAQYYGLGPLIKRLTLCEELNECACGDVLFHAYLPPPSLPIYGYCGSGSGSSVRSSCISPNQQQQQCPSPSVNPIQNSSDLIPPSHRNSNDLPSSSVLSYPSSNNLQVNASHQNIVAVQPRPLPSMEAKFQMPTLLDLHPAVNNNTATNNTNNGNNNNNNSVSSSVILTGASSRLSDPIKQSPSANSNHNNSNEIDYGHATATTNKRYHFIYSDYYCVLSPPYSVELCLLISFAEQQNEMVNAKLEKCGTNADKGYQLKGPKTNGGGMTHSRANSADFMMMGHSGYSSPSRSAFQQGHMKKSSYELARLVFHLLVSNLTYRMKEESLGWQSVYTSPRLEATVRHIALNTKFGAQNTDKMLAIALANNSIHLWNISDTNTPQGTKIGTFSLCVAVDKLFFIGSQLVALSKLGKVGIWHSMTHNWQVQDVLSISCYDTAGSFLLLGCTNGSIYYIDMQKFPLRMKDNDLLITELYRDPNGDLITAISVYLTPKTNICGNWIEIAYGTSSGIVRVIVQHPETVGHGPQLFQTYTVHTSPITRVALTTNHLISVCSEYNHVRSWGVTRFRGMISTQPGSTSLASFKVLTLDSTDDITDGDCTDPGPFGDQDGEQIFVQRVIPETNQIFVRLASNGDRLCTIRSVDGSAITAFLVHECDGSNRMGSRPRRYLFTGTANDILKCEQTELRNVPNSLNLKMWDLTTALDQYHCRTNTMLNSSINPQSTQLDKSAAAAASTSGLMSNPSTTTTPSAVGAWDLFTHSFYSPIYLMFSHDLLKGPTPDELLQLIDECEICCASLNSTPTITPHSSTIHLSELDSLSNQR
ncbi:unnamed protein product [Anisakis simplex]|uniref:BTB domain-containing protein n=1 Tax=Anisakis simplex TaxID=6269 RepID=A0A0M3JRE1_ANISI|nr:unnamed protein product [Anisakis simplex]